MRPANDNGFGPSNDNATPDIVLRPANDNDRGYVLKSWVLGHSYTADAFHAGPNYMPAMWRTTELVLDRSQCLVACASQAPEVVLGFAVVETGPIVHYVFTRPDVRRQGIARTLMATLRNTDGVRISALPVDHSCIKGRIVVVPRRKDGPPPPQVPIPASWVYDPWARWLGNYDASRRAA